LGHRFEALPAQRLQFRSIEEAQKARSKHTISSANWLRQTHPQSLQIRIIRGSALVTALT